MMRRAMGIVRSLMPALLIAALTIHFGLLAIYLMPYNPVKVHLNELSTRYVDPIFTQRWELFAPEPIIGSKVFLVSCRIPDESGEMHETQWIDVTTRLYDMHYRSRISSADRLARAQLAGMYTMSSLHDPLIEHLEKIDPGDDEAAKGVVETIRAAKDANVRRGLRMLTRMASVECDRVHGAGVSRQVRVQMLDVAPPAFSKRDEPNEKGPMKRVDYEWQPYESVEPY